MNERDAHADRSALLALVEVVDTLALAVRDLAEDDPLRAYTSAGDARDALRRIRTALETEDT